MEEDFWFHFVLLCCPLDYTVKVCVCVCVWGGVALSGLHSDRRTMERSVRKQPPPPDERRVKCGTVESGGQSWLWFLESNAPDAFK